MKKEDVASMMGKKGEGVKGGKALEQVGGKLQTKKEPGTEPDKVIVTAIVPAEEATLIPYNIMEDEEGSDCITIWLDDSDVEEIDKVEELAELRHKEADCIDRLAQAVPEMRDNELVIVSEKMQRMDLLTCACDMYERIGNARNFRAALAAGEHLLSLYKYNQVAANVKTVPDLCHYFDVGKTKLYKIL